MDKHLEKYARLVKPSEYRDLFPDTTVEKARKDEEKVKEALFQVHSIIWNEELYNYCENNSRITNSKLDELAENEEQRERISKGIGAVTVSENDEGETVIPCTDILHALTRRTRYWD